MYCSKYSAAVLLLWYILTSNHVSTVPLNTRPIVGVLAQEAFSDSPAATYIPAPYIKWLESAGARVVPVLLFKKNDARAVGYYKELFRSINGLLFPGGGVDILKSQFAKTAQIFYNLALEHKDKYNDSFPLWGTCQGFELLTALVSKQNLLTNVDAEDISLPLMFTNDAFNGRLFGNLPKDVYIALHTKNVTANYHHWSLTPTNYSQNAPLKTFFKVLSTNVDRGGKEFISSMEAYNYPIYAVQWHPEKNNFVWSTQLHLNHGSDAVRVAQYFADFFVSEARKSQHKFPDAKTETKAVIDNYQVSFNAKSLLEFYFFDYLPVNSTVW